MAQKAKKPPTKIVPGEIILRLMIFEESNPTNPKAYVNFEQFFDSFAQNYITEGWRTVALDSIDSHELAARKLEQYVMNPGVKDPRKWWGGSTDKLEETLCMRLAHLKCNVAVITHIDRSKISVHGHALQGPSSGPGRLDKMLPAMFPEIWRSYVTKRDNQRSYELQTMADDQYSAETHIEAPEIAYQNYHGLWEAWDLKHSENGTPKRPDIHALIYGDFGAGKSTLVATFPWPIIVFMFDPTGGKEFPYLNIGIPTERKLGNFWGVSIEYIDVHERVEVEA